MLSAWAPEPYNPIDATPLPADCVRRSGSLEAFEDVFGKLVQGLLAAAVLLVALFASGASFYWLGWPDAVRSGLAIAFVPVVALLWFLPGNSRKLRRALTLVGLALFFFAYASKSPYPQTFVPLHDKVASVAFEGSRVTITNFRDAIHPIGAPAEPRWTIKSFDLDQLTGAQFVLQPFGNSLATVHVMTSFEFSNGDHLAVSFEARRTSWEKFDPLAGFFRHDQLYAVLGTERDLFWKRLAHIPPNELYIFQIIGPADDVRAYLQRLLTFAGSLQERPQFYSTVSESCFTTLLNLMPRLDDVVPWYDLRRWVPGASIGLFQELGLVDASVPTEELVLRRKIGGGVEPPWAFPTTNEWSDQFRSKIGRP